MAVADAVEIEPDFTVSGKSGDTVFILTPQNADAEKHLKSNIGPESMWMGNGVVVEHRYIEDLVMALRRNNFVVGWWPDAN